MPMTDRPPLTAASRDAIVVAMQAIIADISEADYAAGWMDGIEHTLWHAVQTGDREWHGYAVHGDLIPALRKLSLLIDGWVDYDGYVPMADWLERVATKQERKAD